jgi:hypothetical protein
MINTCCLNRKIRNEYNKNSCWTAGVGGYLASKPLGRLSPELVFGTFRKDDMPSLLVIFPTIPCSVADWQSTNRSPFLVVFSFRKAQMKLFPIFGTKIDCFPDFKLWHECLALIKIIFEVFFMCYDKSRSFVRSK